MCLHKEKFQEIENWKEIPLELLDMNIEFENISQLKDKNESIQRIFDYFFNNLSLLDTYLKFNPLVKFLTFMKEFFFMWKIGKFESKILKKESMKELENEFKKIEINFTLYFEDHWINKLKRNLKLYRNAPFEVKENAKIGEYVMIRCPGYLRFANEKICCDDEFVDILVISPKFHKCYKYLSTRLKSKYAYQYVTTSASLLNVPVSSITKDLVYAMYESKPDVFDSKLSHCIPEEFFEDQEFIDKLITFDSFTFLHVNNSCLNYIPLKSVIEILSSKPHEYYYLEGDLCSNMEVLKIVIKSNPNIYQSYPEPTKSKEVDTFMEVNPLVFSYLDPKLQTKERFKLFLQCKSANKQYSPQFPQELSLNDELFQFGLNESIENLSFFSPENKNYLQAVSKHVKFFQLEYLRKEMKDKSSFIYYYSRNELNIFHYLKYKIFGICKDFLSGEWISLNLISFNPEEKEILNEIFMLTRGLYCRLTNRDEKISKFDDIQFHFE
jgi:hypothetical protein